MKLIYKRSLFVLIHFHHLLYHHHMCPPQAMAILPWSIRSITVVYSMTVHLMYYVLVLHVVCFLPHSWGSNANHSTYIVYNPFHSIWVLTLKVLNFWKLTSYCSLKPLWSGMGEVVMAHTLPTLHPHYLPLCINCRDYHCKNKVKIHQYCGSILWYTLLFGHSCYSQPRKRIMDSYQCKNT